MPSEQTSENHFIAQEVAKAPRAAIQTMATPVNTRPKMSGPIMKQPTFHRSTNEKYAELRNFMVQVSGMLQNVNLGQTEGVSVIKNWLGREGLQLIVTLTQEEE